MILFLCITCFSDWDVSTVGTKDCVCPVHCGVRSTVPGATWVEGKGKGGQRGSTLSRVPGGLQTYAQTFPSPRTGGQELGHSAISPQKLLKANRPWRWSSYTGCHWKRKGRTVAVPASSAPLPAPPPAPPMCRAHAACPATCPAACPADMSCPRRTHLQDSLHIPMQASLWSKLLCSSE